jgi:transcriptional regulator with XRE-family HTH domain
MDQATDSAESDATSTVTERAVNCAIGDELRRVRDGRGWTRGKVVELMSSDISVQTLANYESGIRPCTLPRLVDICEALEVSTPALVALALQRIAVEPDANNVQVDLRAIIEDKTDDYKPLRRWAENRLKEDPEGVGVARIDRVVVEEMATFFGRPSIELLRYLYKFMPKRTPRRMTSG